MTNAPRIHGGMAGNGPELDSREFQEMQIGSNSEDLESFSMTETAEKVSTERKKSKRPFLYRVWKFLQVTATSIKGDKPVLLDLELPQRYRPIAIMRLCETTGFSRKEIKRIYWSFKNECPSGLVTQETFHAIYSKFFPAGANFSSYPNYIFSALDHRKTGVINFEDFAVGLSILIKGTMEDKLKWIFHVYDINKDGVLSKSEIREVTAAVYDLMGSPSGERQKSEAVEEIITARAEMAFQKMDLNQDGVVSLEEFLTFNKEDFKMVQSLDFLKTINV